MSKSSHSASDVSVSKSEVQLQSRSDQKMKMRIEPHHESPEVVEESRHHSQTEMHHQPTCPEGYSSVVAEKSYWESREIGRGQASHRILSTHVRSSHLVNVIRRRRIIINIVKHASKEAPSKHKVESGNLAHHVTAVITGTDYAPGGPLGAWP